MKAKWHDYKKDGVQWNCLNRNERIQWDENILQNSYLKKQSKHSSPKIQSLIRTAETFKNLAMKRCISNTLEFIELKKLCKNSVIYDKKSMRLKSLWKSDPVVFVGSNENVCRRNFYGDTKYAIFDKC